MKKSPFLVYCIRKILLAALSSETKPGDGNKAAAIRVTATTIYPYKSFRGMEAGFGEEEGPLFQKGPFLLPKKSSPK